MARPDIVKVLYSQDGLAEWSKALASGASPKGRGFEPHSCHFWVCCLVGSDDAGTWKDVAQTYTTAYTFKKHPLRDSNPQSSD